MARTYTSACEFPMGGYINRYITQQRGITIHSTIALYQFCCINHRTLRIPRQCPRITYALRTRTNSGGTTLHFAVGNCDSRGSSLWEARMSLRITQANYVLLTYGHTFCKAQSVSVCQTAVPRSTKISHSRSRVKLKFLWAPSPYLRRSRRPES